MKYCQPIAILYVMYMKYKLLDEQSASTTDSPEQAGLYQSAVCSLKGGRLGNGGH